MDANPFGEPTADEVTVVDNLQTVLLNIEPTVVQQVLSDLLNTEVPRFEGWQTEVPVAADEDPDLDLDQEISGEGYLIGLSEQPEIIKRGDIDGISSDTDGGRVDLYAAGPGLFVIEAKTKGSLLKSQLSRYADSLPGDHSYKTVSWARLSKALIGAQDQMNGYPGGLTDDLIEYLDEAGLAAPQLRVQRSYISEGEVGLKKFAIKRGDELTIEFSWKEGGDSKPSLELRWDQFVELFKQVDPVVRRDAFIEQGDFDPDQHFNGNTLLGAISPIGDFREDVELRFVYTKSRNALKLGHRKKNGTIGSPVGNGRQGWMITPGEGSDLFVENSEQYPGLDEEVRRALFLDFDRNIIEENLW
jgi:hypothetical protein